MLASNQSSVEDLECGLVGKQGRRNRLAKVNERLRTTRIARTFCRAKGPGLNQDISRGCRVEVGLCVVTAYSDQMLEHRYPRPRWM